MFAWIQARDTMRRVQRVLACALLAWCTVPAWGQANEGMRLTGQKEGTLVVNYYSSAPDPELEQLRSLTVEALGVYLRGQILIEDGDIGWQLSLRHVSRDMERVVSDLMRIRDFTGQDPFRGFSQEVLWLLEDFEELDSRDVGRMRGGEGRLSNEERMYVLVEQRIQEVLLQCGVELGHFVNRGLLQKLGTVEQTLTPEEMAQWTTPTDEPLAPIELDFNLETMSLIGGEDLSAWPDESVPVNPSSDPQLAAMQGMMERILGLLETQEARIAALESGSSHAPANGPDVGDWARSLLDLDRISPSMDEELKGLNLPAQFDVQFYEGSARLTLTAQLQLNEVMEYMGMYPQLRVVCTGHADVTGDRAANLALSKRRAQAVRSHLLESGVTDSRVVLNYFGEERASNRGALDRRVEVSFFVND